MPGAEVAVARGDAPKITTSIIIGSKTAEVLPHAWNTVTIDKACRVLLNLQLFPNQETRSMTTSNRLLDMID